MGWDVQIVRIRGNLRPLASLQNDDFLPLGDLAAVRCVFQSACPAATWSNPLWALYYGDGLDVEIDLQYVESSNSVGLCFHGKRNPIPWLLTLTEKHGWLTVDLSSGELVDPNDPTNEGWEGWRDLVDGIHDEG